jgi:lipoprotein-releasing system permease protein
MPFSLFLALKYLKPKRSVTSVITCVSVIGVLLGVAVVIIVRAVMTGFGDLWEQKILDFKPHVTIKSTGPGPVIRDGEVLAKQIAALPGVVAASPEINTPVMLQRRGLVATPILIGVDPDCVSNVYKVGDPVAGAFDLEGDAIVLGVDLARKLHVFVGDEVTIYSPKTLAARDEIYLPLKWRVTGIFSSGQRDYDAHFAFCSLPNARDLMGLENGVFVLNVKTAQPANASALDDVCRRIADLAPTCYVETWRQTDREIFNALAVEKNMTAILLLLVTVVALFCVMNTLLVLTVQKTSEVGLLKALGFSKAKIMGAFVVHGLVQVTAGTVLGLAAAYAVLRNLQNLVDFLARLGVQVFPKAVYGLDAIPYRLVAADVTWVVVIVYVFGLLASLVPAFLAASKNPVEALKG